jgi:hypothetical protein
MWALIAALLALWFVFKFFLHKGGWIHILLLTAISITVVQLLAERKTRFQKNSSKK